MNLPESILAEIREHAARDYPRESCGLVVLRRGRYRYIACRNVAPGALEFAIDPEDYAAAEDAGEVKTVVHSHPNLPPVPSQADLIGCEQSGLPWLIVNWPTGSIYQFAPSGYCAPLTGRKYSYGVLDCQTLIYDYYHRVLGIALPPFEAAPYGWWLNGQNLYVERFAEAGFVQVSEPKEHDALLMQIGSPVPNHGGLYLDGGVMLHHLMGRLSSRDVYGGWYRKVTTHVLRHRSLIK